MKSDLVIEKALENFELFQLPESPPENLSLLEELQHRLRKTKPFANIDVIFIQHHLGPFIGRLHAMIASGLDPNRTWFVDIPYSTNPVVVGKLGELGFSVQQRTERFDDPLSRYGSGRVQARADSTNNNSSTLFPEIARWHRSDLVRRYLSRRTEHHH